MKNHEHTLAQLMHIFKKEVSQSKHALEMIHRLNLNRQQLDVGYNSGELKQLSPALRDFGINQLIFPIFNNKKEIINLCTIGKKAKDEQFLFQDRHGLFPMVVEPHHKRVYLTDSILKAAVFYAQGLEEDEAVLVCPNGKLTTEVFNSIKTILKPINGITAISKIEES